jgi:hypothetical protein
MGVSWASRMLGKSAILLGGMSNTALLADMNCEVCPMMTSPASDTHLARLLLAGPDTLYVSFDSPISEEMQERLETAKTAAQAEDAQGRVYCPEWLGGESARPARVAVTPS